MTKIILVYGARLSPFACFLKIRKILKFDSGFINRSLLTAFLLISGVCSYAEYATLDNSEIIFEDIIIDDTDQIRFQLNKQLLVERSENNSTVTIDAPSQNFMIDGVNNQSSSRWLSRLTTQQKIQQITPNDDFVRFSFEPSPDMVGKKLRVFLEKEDDLSKVALFGAFLPQVIPLIAINSVSWQPSAYTNTLMKWNHLLTGQDLTGSFAKLIHESVFADSSPLFEQCSTGFLQGLTAYSMGTYGEGMKNPDPATLSDKVGQLRKKPHWMSNSEAFRGMMATTPTNNLVNCISAIVGDNLKTLHSEGKIQRVFGNWSQVESLNEQTLDGIAKLMVGYSFNMLANIPGGTLSLVRNELGLYGYPGIQGDFNEALKTSIQYTIHNGYMEYFNGRGWSDELSYGMTSGIGLIEIAYRIGRVASLNLGQNPTENMLATNEELHHQVVSIGERAEAIVSSAYQFVPIPEDIREYAIVGAAAILGPLAAYAIMDSMINYYAVGGANLAVQQMFTSATNGLLLGAIAYVLLPYVQKQAAYYTQKAADRFMDWSKVDKNGWVGYFAARNTHYKISFLIIK